MTVFANGMEISAKAQGCKLIAAMPDVCMTPPQTPATPPGVPIPYPNFGMDSDLTSGSTSVKIGGKPVSKENSSNYSKCSGDEAGCAPKKGVITSKNTGPVYAQAWSMDVKVEGKGVVRFGDIATSNHGCNPGQPPPIPLVGQPGGPGFEDSLDCLVGSYETIHAKCNERGGEAHHIIPDEFLRNCDRDGAEAAAKLPKPDATRLDPSFPSINEGCCICVGGKSSGKSSSERTSDVGKGIAAKGRQRSADTGARPIHDCRGHGYMHYYFDAKFGNKPRPIGDAVKIAKEALTNLAKFKSSIIDADCADKGKECVEKQMESACAKKPQPKCQPNVNKSNERFDNAADRLNAEGNLTKNLMPSRSASLT